MIASFCSVQSVIEFLLAIHFLNNTSVEQHIFLIQWVSCDEKLILAYLRQGLVSKCTYKTFGCVLDESPIG